MSNRVEGLDIIKCFAAVLIVLLHWPVANAIGQSVHMMARVAVPVFFMITGYFLQLIIDKGRINSYLSKILKMTVFAYCLYILYAVYCNGLGALIPSVDSLVLWLLTGQNNIGGHLWYLNALLYACLLLWFMSRHSELSRWHWLIPMLFAANYAISSFVTESYFYRNWLFMAMPYILLGDWIRCHQKRFTQSSYVATVSYLFLIGEVLGYQWGG